MKAQVTKVFDGHVKSQVDVAFEAEENECAEFKKALSFIKKYEKRAIEQLISRGRRHPKESEIHKFDFAVKDGRITVSVTEGMLG